jgi:hypothetical protein
MPSRLATSFSSQNCESKCRKSRRENNGRIRGRITHKFVCSFVLWYTQCQLSATLIAFSISRVYWRLVNPLLTQLTRSLHVSLQQNRELSSARSNVTNAAKLLRNVHAHRQIITTVGRVLFARDAARKTQIWREDTWNAGINNSQRIVPVRCPSPLFFSSFPHLKFQFPRANFSTCVPSRLAPIRQSILTRDSRTAVTEAVCPLKVLCDEHCGKNYFTLYTQRVAESIVARSIAE